MIKNIIKLLSKSILCILCLIFITSSATAATNTPSGDIGDIGDFGTWATPNNRELFTNGLTKDLQEFQSGFQAKVLVKDYVPIEAKVGRAFIGALSSIGEILERSLVRFMSIFMITLFIFWIMFEAYNMMTKTHDVKKLAESIVKKLLLITVWILIIEQGPAQIFMWLMGPIISIGTHLSDLILNSVATASGASLPDTCAAIHNYMAQNPINSAIIDSAQTANLLCVPTRLSGFFYTAVAAGWQWMLAGIGTSIFTFVVGAVFVVIFLFNIWKFALMALGVIADLFLGIIMLPFTALMETFGGKGKTTYEGYAGLIFNGFLDLFKADTLEAQIMRFINAVIYFVSLSIVVAICAAIMSGVIDADLAKTVPGIENDGFMITLIVGCLVAYLANKAGDIAKNIGGSISSDADGYAKQFGDDIKKVWGNTTKTVTSWTKAARGKK